MLIRLLLGLLLLLMLMLLLLLMMVVMLCSRSVTPVLRLLSLHPPLGLLHQSEGANVEVLAWFQLSHGKDGNVLVLELRLCAANRRRISVQRDRRRIGADGGLPAVRANGADDEADDAADEDDGDDGQAEHLKVAPWHAL